MSCIKRLSIPYCHTFKCIGMTDSSLESGTAEGRRIRPDNCLSSSGESEAFEGAQPELQESRHRGGGLSHLERRAGEDFVHHGQTLTIAQRTFSDFASNPCRDCLDHVGGTTSTKLMIERLSRCPVRHHIRRIQHFKGMDLVRDLRCIA